MSRLRDSGDTIVEVLICTAIVSSVLAGAYSSASRSLYQIQKAQERVEATKLVEQQAERLKAASKLLTASSTGIYMASPPASFCLNETLTFGATCSFGLGGRYTLGITRGGDNRTFAVRAVWDRIGGGVPEEINAVYRVYP